ncbi:hypothetical protein [Rummeliibacillus pycnus]|uniref:hypothetical protein n=1 Tax=Rummeliibacillus pycnus TaxID=101070 RepID=UPI0037C95084
MEHLEDIIGGKLLLKSIIDIENGSAPRIKQPKERPTVRARQIKASEYKEIIDWEEWEIERIWHLLRGTQNWLNVFDFSEIQGEVSKWRILHFEREEVLSSLKLGTAYQEEDTYFVYCRKGKIYMELSVDLVPRNNEEISAQVSSLM